MKDVIVTSVVMAVFWFTIFIVRVEPGLDHPGGCTCKNFLELKSIPPCNWCIESDCCWNTHPIGCHILASTLEFVYKSIQNGSYMTILDFVVELSFLLFAVFFLFFFLFLNVYEGCRDAWPFIFRTICKLRPFVYST